MPIVSVNQELPINVHGWIPDSQYLIYPEGARPKTAYFAPDKVSETFIKKGRRYLFKKSSHAPDDQFWAEIVAYKIGCMLDINVPPTYAAYDSSNNICGALVEWFYLDGETRFFNGGQYMQRVIADYDLDSGDQHNLDTILKICRTLSMKSSVQENSYILKTDYIKYWGELILFDALIGNSDRHQNNWGITSTRDNELGKNVLEFSPLYDNGTSLGSTRYIHKLDAWPEQQFNTYVQNGRHHMKLNIDSATRASHLELVSHYLGLYPQLKKHLYDKISSFCFDAFDSELKKLMSIDMPIPLNEKRAIYYKKFTAIRQNKLLEKLT